MPDFKAGNGQLPPLSWTPTHQSNGFAWDLTSIQPYIIPRAFIDQMPYPFAPAGFQGEGIQAVHEAYDYWRFDAKTPPPSSFLAGLLVNGLPSELGNLRAGVGDFPRLFNLKG